MFLANIKCYSQWKYWWNLRTFSNVMDVKWGRKTIDEPLTLNIYVHVFISR